MHGRFGSLGDEFRNGDIFPSTSSSSSGAIFTSRKYTISTININTTVCTKAEWYPCCTILFSTKHTFCFVNCTEATIILAVFPLVTRSAVAGKPSQFDDQVPHMTCGLLCFFFQTCSRSSSRRKSTTSLMALLTPAIQ